MKPYRTMPIQECGEPLVAIPPKEFAFFEPHAYMAKGAPYGGASPWMLRQGVLAALRQAQARLHELRPGWKLKLFDAYRPNAVQDFMVEDSLAAMAREQGLDPAALPPLERQRLMKAVIYYWSPPSLDPATPPLHSTGGAVDCTLVDADGAEAEMGAQIDQCDATAAPDYYKSATDPLGQAAHANRLLLRNIMEVAGFEQVLAEWWHFSKGDQYWAWRQRENAVNPQAFAIYGRADLL